MSWFRMDDKAAFHKKVLKAGNEAFGALVRMGCWSSDHLTDGRIPIETAALIAGPGDAGELVLTRLRAVGFLEADGEDLVMHDYLEYNPAAADVKEKRRAESDRKKNGRKEQGRDDSGRITTGLRDVSARIPAGQNTESSETATGPVPIPIPLSEKEKKPARVRVALDVPNRLAAFGGWWGSATGILMDDGHQLGLVVEKLTDYAKTIGRPFEDVTDEAMAAFREESEGWSEPRPLTAKLFNAKWSDIQGRMGGKVPKAKASAPRKRVDEPSPRPKPPSSHDVFVAKFGEADAKKAFGL